MDRRVVDACCTSRRQFIGGLTTLGASALMSVTAKSQTPFRIDVHHHIFPRQVLDLQEKLNPAWSQPIGGFRLLRPPPLLKEWTPAIMIEAMDKNGVAAAIGSPPAPGAWFGNPPAARQIMRAWNEYAAGIVRDYRSRFGFFAMLAPPDVDCSLKEIEYALDVLKADGIGLYSNYEGKYLGEQAFAPMFDELNRRKAAVYIHPIFAPCCMDVQPGVRINLLEFPFDSTRNIVSLLYSGTLSRCPDIRFIISHGGGVLPMLAGRIELLSEEHKGVNERIPRGIPYELDRLYSDTAGTTSAASINAVLSVMPKTNLLYGTDFPFLPIAQANQGLAAIKLPLELMQAIERHNALALFPRLKG
jgi:6-methylsalicylate decarboxylase